MVYWLRRISIGVVVIALLAGGYWLVKGRHHKSAAAPVASASASAAAPAPSLSAPASVAPVFTQPAVAPAASSAGSAAAGPAAAAIGVCPGSSIAVVASANHQTYAPGRAPKFTLTITNTGSVACQRNVGPKANALLVTSGGVHVWSSDDCNPSSLSKILTLKPGEKVATSIVWDRTVTKPGCPTKGTKAQSGRYQVIGKNGKVTSAPANFSLIK